MQNVKRRLKMKLFSFAIFASQKWFHLIGLEVFRKFISVTVYGKSKHCDSDK